MTHPASPQPPIATRPTLFHVLLHTPLLWPDGATHIPAGALGRVILSWPGDRAGILVEWGPGLLSGLPRATERHQWSRVPPPPAQTDNVN